jgi:hypothetical protein
MQNSGVSVITWTLIRELGSGEEMFGSINHTERAWAGEVNKIYVKMHINTVDNLDI